MQRCIFKWLDGRGAVRKTTQNETKREENTRNHEQNPAETDKTCVGWFKDRTMGLQK